MVTNPIGRRVALVLVLAVGSVTPCLAKVSGEDFTVEGGLVRSFADDFTDAYISTLLLLSGADGATIRLDYIADGAFFYIGFWDRGERLHDLLNHEEAVEVVFRCDALEAVTLTAVWSTRNKRAATVVSEVWVEELADMVLGAETIIFRVGSQGEILRVPVPDELPEMVAEFRRRVAEATMAAQPTVRVRGVGGGPRRAQNNAVTGR